MRVTLEKVEIIYSLISFFSLFLIKNFCLLIYTLTYSNRSIPNILCAQLSPHPPPPRCNGDQGWAQWDHRWPLENKAHPAGGEGAWGPGSLGTALLGGWSWVLSWCFASLGLKQIKSRTKILQQTVFQRVKGLKREFSHLGEQITMNISTSLLCVSQRLSAF